MKQPKIEIYTTSVCPFCLQAKMLLKNRGLRFEEVNLIESPDRQDEMVRRASGRTSVPQIFISDKHIGGFEELAAIDKSGELDNILSGIVI